MPLDQLAARLRAASGPAAREVREALAGAIREEAMRVLVHLGVGPADRDDLAQQATLKVLTHIEEGRARPGFERGFVATVARCGAIDLFRAHARAGRHQRVLEALPGQQAEPEPDWRPREATREAGDDTMLGAALNAAPESYRDVLMAVYLREIPIETLARAEVAARVARGEVPDTLRTRDEAYRLAQSNLHRRVARARAWVRRHIARAEEA